MPFQEKPAYSISDLLQIMEILRSPEGCPWDREQTHQSIRRNFIEETYEAVEAIDTGDTALLKEELGDVLLQVVFHVRMEEEAGRFSFDDICDGICKKLIHRHPHIFSDVNAETSEEVLRNWESIKRQEKEQETVTQSLEQVSKALPALIRSEKVQKRAARVNFDYDDVSGAFADMESEVRELQEAILEGDSDHREEELGDLLFATVNVARFLEIDPENALTKSTDKFVSRFSNVEALAKEREIDVETAGYQVLDSLWKEVKNNCQ